MRVFYSHPMKLYGTETERQEIALIKNQFIGCEIVDPSAHQSSSRDPRRETEFYLGLVDSCDCLVFSRLFGYVTDGVRPEVEHALSKGKLVYDLRDGRLIPFTGPVVNLPMSERLILRAKGALGLTRRKPLTSP